MSSIALSFNNVDLTTIDNGDGQLWVTSKQLAEALDYKTMDSVTRIYNRYSDEFTDSMSQTLTVTEAVNSATTENKGSLVTTTRIFSLRGCHLVAMFARTKVAKDFRVWVLNILDAHVANNLTQCYQLGDLQRMSDEVDVEYAIGFSVASNGGKVMNNWKGKKAHLEARKAVIQDLMQPLLTGFNDAKAVKVKK